MAVHLRDARTGTVLSFRACADELRFDRLVMVNIGAGQLCPVHRDTTCVETYVSGRRLAQWSLRDFLTYRRARRTGGAR